MSIRFVALALLFVGACDEEIARVVDSSVPVVDDLAVEDLSTPDLSMPDLATVDQAQPILYDFGLFPDGANAPLIVPHTDWVATCQTLAACLLLYGGSTLSQCIGYEQQPGRSPPLSPPVIACVRAAGADCTKAAACLNGGDPDVSCDPSTTEPACRGNEITYCNQPGVHTALDCGPFGYVCSGTTNPGCGLGDCSSGSACVGGVAGHCSAGRLIPSDDCRMYTGGSCDADGGFCLGSGASCMSERCSGSTWVACRGGFEVSFDCAAFGLGCVDTSVGPRCALGTDCTSAFTDTCNGNVVTFCNGGRIDTFDCAAAGWKSCVAGACSN